MQLINYFDHTKINFLGHSVTHMLQTLLKLCFCYKKPFGSHNVIFRPAKLVIVFFLFSVVAFSQPRELTLEECRKLAIENNQQLEIARQHKLAATAFRKASFTKFLPGFDFTGSYLRTNKKFNFLEEDMLLPVIPYTALDPQTGQVDPIRLFNPDLHPENTGIVFIPGTSEFMTCPDGNPLFHDYTWIPEGQLAFGQKNNYLLNMGMSQIIYAGGKIRTQHRISSQIETIARHGEYLELSAVLYETEKLYWQVYTLREKRKLADSYHELLENMVEDLENLYEEGMVSQNDLLKARVKLNEANLDRIKARNSLELASMALCRIIGLPITTEIITNDSLWIKDEIKSLDALYNKALQNRPELQIASVNVELGKSAVKLAESRFLPDIALSANYFMVNPDPYHGFSDQFGRDWNVGLVMRIPVFHWNERRHILNVSRHEKKVQELKLQDFKELVRLEVSKIFYEISEAHEKVNVAALSLKQAEENLKLAEDNFDVGALTTTELLEAQTLWRKAYSNHVEAKSELILQHTNMQKAIGELMND